MKAEFENKLRKIADVWNYFIWDYKFCSSKIKFNEDVKTNYFGDILGYFQDTIDIVFVKNKNLSHTSKFSFTISFLQAIYVQQDFIQEMLEIFKTGVDKGELKKDINYSINRDIRNELIGHPIRKYDGRLISSTLFSYHALEDEIEYLRYHRDNNFKFESKTYKIKDIQLRHEVFLERYFDVILEKLKVILNEYLIEIEKVENVIKTKDFNTVLKLVELYFEAIFESDFLYNKEALIDIYNRKDQHLRYSNFIERFYNDLTSSLIEKRNFVKEIYEKQPIKKSKASPLPKIKIEFISSKAEIQELNSIPRKETYHYEIGKIATKRNYDDFAFFGGILRSKCQNNELILQELDYMELNISNEIEYYTALRLICSELKEE